MQESEIKYRTLFEQAVDAILLIDPDSGEFVEFNTKAHEQLGYTREEFKKLKIPDFEVLQSRDDIFEEFNKILRNGFDTFETKQRTKDGEIRDIYVNAKSIEIRGKKFIQTISRDITEQKKMAEKMQESEIKYRTLFEQAADTIILIDPESGEFVEFNDKAHEQLGYTREEFKELKIWDFEVLQSRDDVFEEFNRIIRDGFHAFETKQKTKNGEIKDILVSSKPLDIRGKKFIQTIWKDITEQKKMAEKIRESEIKYRTLFEQAADTVILIDPESGELVEFNDIAHDRLGYTREEFKKLKIPDFEVLQSHDDVKEHFNTILREGSEAFETKQRTKNGEIKDIFVSTRSIVIRGKRFIQTIWRDITETKKAEKKLKESEARYREAYEQIEFYKDLFAHDINNILQNIKMSLDLLLIWRNNSEKMDKMLEIMNIINEQLIRGSKLVTNIRKISEISEIGSHMESIEANHILNEAINFICTSFPEKNIDIKIESQIEVINVKANQILLDIFENILFNSIRHNNNKKIEILIKISKEIKNYTNYVKFEFIDNGIGISDIMKKRIFEGISTRKEKKHGMGLGLLLVKKVLSSYNGEIWVEDKVQGNPSQGSNFIILIPEVM